MRSLARRHFITTVAARESAAAASRAATRAAIRAATAADDAAPAAGRTAYTSTMALLVTHKAALKAIKSVKAKVETKREFLPEYDAYVAGVLESGAGVQDDIVMTIMVWRLDAGLFAEALDIAAYAVRHGLKMPDGFARDVPTAVVEEIAEAAMDNPELAGFVHQALDLMEDADMPDEVRAKAYKALGRACADTDPEGAVKYLKMALDFDSNCGVKTQLAKLEKHLADQKDDDDGGTDAA